MLQSHCCEPDRKSPGHAAVLNALDSRALGSVSCYAQRFMRPGSYAYNVVPGYGQLLSSDHPFLVRVGEEKGRQMAQHNVVVSSAEEGFDVDPHELSINLGDLVLWSGN